jgi:cardiolipin synthase
VKALTIRPIWRALASCLALAALVPLGWSTGPTSPNKVVINEIAWSGTACSYSDEWIELHNPTAQAVDLSGWVLTAADGTPSINLEGVIASGGYLLLERSDDSTVVDIPADLTYIGALEDTGEVLQLWDAQGSLIDSANGDGGPWPAGSNDPDISVERIAPLAADTDANWVTNDGVTRNGYDCGWNPIAGTPRAWNSGTPDAANLRVRKTGPKTLVAGNEITYTLALSNLGTLPAGSTTLSDRLPQEVAYLRDSAPTPPQQPVPGLLVWNLGTVPTGGLPITFTVVGLVDGEPGSTLWNAVTATSPVTDAIPGDNAAIWASLLVSPPAQLPDLSLAKTGPISVAAGSQITYTLSLSNLGVLPATGSRLTDALPTAVAYLRDTAPYSLEQPSPALLVWHVGEVPTGSTPLTFTLTGRVSATPGTTITNTLAAGSSLTDAHPADNRTAWASLVVPPPPSSTVLIDALLYDGYVSSDLDEGVRLWNQGPDPADLSGWRVTDGRSRLTIPVGTVLAPGTGLWLARDASAFAQSFGFAPDLVPEVWPGFSNTGDECLLETADGESVDVLIYADGQADLGGWSGPSVQPYIPTNAFPREGQMLYRKRDQATGHPLPDTDTAADWAQDPDDGIDGRRVQYPGWDLDAHFFTTHVTETATLTVAVGPDNLFDALADLVGSAQSSIQLELYTFESVSLTHILTARLTAGVSVTVLLEGGPVGGPTDQQRWVASILDQAGAQVYFLSGDDDEIHTRYAYQHAKVAIVDGRQVALGSENWSRRGVPDDPKANGTAGRRGTYLLTDAPGVVAAAQAVFVVDVDPAHHADVVHCNDLPPEKPYCTPPVGFTPPPSPDWTTYTVRFLAPLVTSGTFAFEWLQAPENVLRTQDSLLGLLARAGPGDVIRVEQNYEHPTWGADDNPIPNPRLEAYLDAARRGATVHILLDGFESHQGRNLAAVETINDTARHESLALRARVGNPTAAGIHNKMVLAELDHHGYIHVGSLNGGEASHKLNRELALQVQSDAAHAYLAAVFDHDWGAATPPVYLPVMLRNWSRPSPPDHLLISEVYYAAPKLLEWIEIHNPTAEGVDLSGWRLGDAASPGDHEGMYTFPPYTVLPPGGTMVVAVSAVSYGWGLPDLELYDTTLLVPDMIRDAAWGAGEWELASAGDEVVLLLGDGTPVDVVTYGSGSYPGVIPHPGVSQSSHSLARLRAWLDTDDCSSDFFDEPSPKPGEPPP